jgi:hypothetical protein
LAQQEAQVRLAVLLFAAADQIREDLKLLRESVDQEIYLERLSVLRKETDLATFDSSWRQGQNLLLDDALRHAMQELFSDPPLSKTKRSGRQR